jgi:hypothetical protein
MIFPGNTSDFLLTLAVGTAVPMVLGWFLIRPCPYTEHVSQPTIDDDNQEESDDVGFALDDETSELIRGNKHAPPLNIAGLAMMRTIDFWILFWTMSLRECLCRDTKVH